MITNAKHLLSRLEVSKKIVVRFTSALIISGSVGTVAYAGTTDKIIIEVDGKKQEIYTHANTIDELLQDERIQVTEKDHIYPAPSTKITGEMKIVVEKARPFGVVVDGKEKQVRSTAKTVKDLLAEEHIKISEHDKVYPSLYASLEGTQKIMIQKAFPVTLHVGGQEQQVWSTSTTVANFLKERQVSLNEIDRVEPDLQEVMQQNMKVKVVRVEKVSDAVEEPIPYTEVRQEDSSLRKGAEKVIQEGIEGKKKKVFAVIKEDGNEVLRNLQKEEIVQEEKNRIVAVGTKEEENILGDAEGVVANEFYVQATAYSPYCGGCQGVSAGGYNYKENPNMKLIAVDPRIIPLGTKVWVEGYGYAVAGDTGGAIKGHRIDVLMPTESQVEAWGRKQVKIKVLQ
ncbi:G5 and 3D domain-containing protein [Bacillus multifaciens]|uniref:G5 and 3D domain-containing protein n=1 Tax=Bacillus multifaciens TaxID=3068506 RepID=UPI0027422539|nr:G5 and 3D domain-containing protein [Bacillus sp. WLY-B-L8]MDP7980089.1 ubiquitin-like domain-containing protein [Bacillus sp. WLY-B-L8]